jgi:hypothetical protein
VTAAAFKRSIRDLQVWCSSCMVAFSGADPIGVLIGAKRPSGTLVHRIAVHPDHRRQGHGRHLLASLGSKLAILGPPRIVAEVPETLAPACELFSGSGYVQEALLTDYVLHPTAHTTRRGDPGERDEGDARKAAGPESRVPSPEPRVPGFVIPVTVDDLAANGLLDHAAAQTCWGRSAETLTARRDEVAGLGVASEERIEAYLLHVNDEILSLRSFVEDGGARLNYLFSRLRAQDMGTLRFPKVHPGEISKDVLETLGFRAVAAHRLYAARARSG